MMHKLIHFCETILGKLFFRSFNVLRFCLTDKYFINTININTNPHNIFYNFHKIGYSKLQKINSENIINLQKYIKINEPKTKPKNYVHYFDLANKPIKLILKKIINLDLKDSLVKLDQYYKKKVFVTNIVMRRTYSIPAIHNQNEYFNNFFHIDSYLKNHFKIFVLLSNVNENCGPTEIFDFEISKKICKKNGIFSKRGFLDVDGYEAFKNTGSAGDVLLCNTSKCLHRAKVPTNKNYRDMLVFTLCAYPNLNKYVSRFAYEENFSSSIWDRNSELTKKFAKPQGYRELFNFIRQYNS